jgi:hypothetical protein
MDIEVIEKETTATLSIDETTGKVIVEGSEEASDRAIALLREDAAEATKQLRKRQGLSAVKTVKREIQLDWSRDNEVQKQVRFGAAHSEYHKWSERELAMLGEFLKPGDEVVPTYAFSCYIVRNGAEIHYSKNGKVLA